MINDGAQLPAKVWVSALVVSFCLYAVLLVLSIPSIFLVLLILILALGSAILTKVFLSGTPESHSSLEKWLFVFVSSLFINLICLLVEGDLAIIVPLMLIYGFGLFMFNSVKSFGLYFLLAVAGLGFQLYWLNSGFAELSVTSLWGYLAIFFSMVLFLFLYNHDFQVKNRAFHLLSDQLGRYYEQEKQRSTGDVCIIHTDKALEITPVSHAAQHALFNYQTSVVGKKLFSVLYLKDETGVLIGNNNQLMIDLVDKQEHITLDHLTLILPNTAKQFSASLSVHPVITIDGEIAHIEFVLRVPDLKTNAASPVFESQRMAFTSLLTNLKRQIGIGNKTNSLFATEVLEKAYLHMRLFEDLRNGLLAKPGLIDSAQVVRSFVQNSFPLITLFKGQVLVQVDKKQDPKEDSLFPQTMRDSVQELTGPFYTIQSDSALFESLLDTTLYCLLAVCMYEKEKQIDVQMNSDERNVRLTFSCAMDMDAQNSFKKLFESDNRILNAGDVPYMLGIESALLLQLAAILEIEMNYEVGSRTIITYTLKRYISKNNKIK